MTNLTFFFYFVPILSGILLCVNLLLAPHNPYEEKKTAFECGFHSFLWQNRIQFAISFFIFALLFLLFDLEILLIYPYSVSQYTNEIYGLTIMIIFFILLTIGFCFEFGKKGLRIDSRQLFRNNYLSKVKDKLLVGYKNRDSLNLGNLVKNSTSLSKPITFTIMGISFIFYYDPQAVTNLVNDWMNSINIENATRGIEDVARSIESNGKKIDYPIFDPWVPKTMAEYFKYKAQLGVQQLPNMFLPHMPWYNAPDYWHFFYKMLNSSSPLLATLLAYNLPNIYSSLERITNIFSSVSTYLNSTWESITNTFSNIWTYSNSAWEDLNYFLARNFHNIIVFPASNSSMDDESDHSDNDRMSDISEVGRAESPNSETSNIRPDDELSDVRSDLSIRSENTEDENERLQAVLSVNINRMNNNLDTVHADLISLLRERYRTQEEFAAVNELILNRITIYFNSEGLTSSTNIYNNFHTQGFDFTIPGGSGTTVDIDTLLNSVDITLLNGFSLIGYSINSEDYSSRINNNMHGLQRVRTRYFVLKAIFLTIKENSESSS